MVNYVEIVSVDSLLFTTVAYSGENVMYSALYNN